jgi:hypothetical protein
MNRWLGGGHHRVETVSSAAVCRLARFAQRHRRARRNTAGNLEGFRQPPRDVPRGFRAAGCAAFRCNRNRSSFGVQRISGNDAAAPGTTRDAGIAAANVRDSEGLVLDESMVSCQNLIANLTNYLDGDIAPEMKKKSRNTCDAAIAARRFTTARARCW